MEWALIQKKPLKLLADVTQHTKYEKKLYLVGGSVRDWLLDRDVDCDYDLVTEFDVFELAVWLNEQGCLDAPPVVYPRFGTVKLSILGYDLELVTARSESYSDGTRKPEVEKACLRDDILRRDFTINTLIYNLHTQEVQDLTGFGMRDLHLGVLRTPLPPEQTFHDDPLRILRALRFQAQLGFEPVPQLEQAASSMASRLKIVSGERIREELQKTVRGKYACDGLYSMMDWAIWPELMGVDAAVKEVDWIELVPIKFRWPYAYYPISGGLDASNALIKRLRFSSHEALALRACGEVFNNPGEIDVLIKRHKHLVAILSVMDAMQISPKDQRDRLREIANRKPTSPVDGLAIAKLRNDIPVTDIGRIKAHLVRLVMTGELSGDDKETASNEVLRWHR